MDDSVILQNLLEEMQTLRQVVYCLGVYVVFGLFALFGKR